MMYKISVYNNFQELPQGFAALFAAKARDDMFYGQDWFELLMRNVYADDNLLRIYGVEDAGNGAPLLAAPMRFTVADYAAPGVPVLACINHPENFTEAALVFSPAAGDPAPILKALFRHLKTCRPDGAAGVYGALRICPFAENSALAKVVLEALHAAGYWVQVYENSYNRYEDVNGRDYEAYFAQRSANLRYSVRRRQRALEKSGKLSLELHRDEAGLQECLKAYIDVSFASWKTPPMMVSEETLEFMHLAAARGCLRLGLLRYDGKPAAVQFWVVAGGVGHCARLAYHEDYKHLAVGVVLTSFMIAQVIDRDHVEKIDFGFGVEDYKAGWMKDARHYQGYMAFNPGSRGGLLNAIKHIFGRKLKRLVHGVLKAAGLRKPRQVTLEE